MKVPGYLLLGCAAALALLVARDATPLWAGRAEIARAEPAPAFVRPPAPARSESPKLLVDHGFAEIGTAFQRGAGSAPSHPDRLSQAEAAVRADKQSRADDQAATRADTVPPGTPREL